MSPEQLRSLSVHDSAWHVAGNGNVQSEVTAGSQMLLLDVSTVAISHEKTCLR
jgi:hypothetical protein